VYEEVPCIAEGGSTKRIDIIAIDPDRNALVIDPTIRFELSNSQTEEVDREKKSHYEPTIPDLKEKFNLESVEVIGIMIGARGTIPKFFEDFRRRFNLPKQINTSIVDSVIKDSVYILRNHLYNFNSM